MMLELVFGFVAGVAACAIVAHNKPEWFSAAVKKAAEVENKVEESVKDKLKN